MNFVALIVILSLSAPENGDKGAATGGANIEKAPAQSEVVKSEDTTKVEPQKESSAPASAAVDSSAAKSQAEAAKVNFSGYLRPTYTFVNRPAANPGEVWAQGIESAQLGMVLTGEPLEKISYMVHINFDINRTEVLTPASTLVDTDGDGSGDSFVAKVSTVLGDIVEESTIRVQALPMLRIRVGQMRVPFTVEASRYNASLVFKRRAEPTVAFNSGSDLGGLAELNWHDGLISASVGVFNGDSVPTDATPANGYDERGTLYSMRLDLSPLGKMPAGIDFAREGLRISAGGGLTYYPNQRFKAGFKVANFQDVRTSGSLMVAFRGFFAQAEILHATTSDDVTNINKKSMGGYVQATHYLPLNEKFGLSAVARLGTVDVDPGYDARRTQWLAAGFSLHFARDDNPDVSRLVAVYEREDEVTMNEQANKISLLYQLEY